MKAVVITGATAGLGLHTAARLAGEGWHVVLGHRDESRGQAAAQRIRRRTPQASIELLEIDLADLRSVATAAEALCRKALAGLPAARSGRLPRGRTSHRRSRTGCP